jgi:NADPH:quinone reductase-like Zn-dependent oxidoreductase
MKKVIFNQYGNFDDLQMVETAIPTIRENELLVRVKAAAINPLDWKIIEGQMKMITGSKFPKGVAFDFAGVVEKTGSGVTAFNVGDAIFGAMPAMKGEALAEYLVIAEPSAYKKPDSISFETAAAMTSVGAAALHIFQKSKARPGDNILINGASGGVGLLAVQMAKKQGMKVTAVASGKGLSFLEKWKPDMLIDYKSGQVLGQNAAFDTVFELSGTLPFGKAKPLMKSRSTFVSTLPNPKDMALSFVNNLWSSKKFKIIMATPTQENLRDLCDWVTQKGLEMPIARTFSMSEFKEAYHFARKGGVIGKVVFTM